MKSNEHRKKREERVKVGNNNGQLGIATPPRVAQAKPPGPKQIFNCGSFSEVGQKQKTEKKRGRERAKVGNNNGQLRIATPPQVAHAKPPEPKYR